MFIEFFQDSRTEHETGTACIKKFLVIYLCTLFIFLISFQWIGAAPYIKAVSGIFYEICLIKEDNGLDKPVIGMVFHAADKVAYTILRNDGIVIEEKNIVGMESLQAVCNSDIIPSCVSEVFPVFYEDKGLVIRLEIVTIPLDTFCREFDQVHQPAISSRLEIL